MTTTEWQASDRPRQTVHTRVNGNRVKVFVGVLWRRVDSKVQQTDCGHNEHSKRSSAVACAETVAKRLNRTGNKHTAEWSQKWSSEVAQ
jgi:hypothetical protein